jgi:competence protein ComEA
VPRECGGKETTMKQTKQWLAGALAALALSLALAAPVPAAEVAAVDINTASEEQLTSLPGIGPSKAKAIVEYRTATPFRTIEEVMNVRGIGESTFENLKGMLTVGAAAQAKDSVKR